jgi:drug/metabolite transporter (DMT)-like permease
VPLKSKIRARGGGGEGIGAEAYSRHVPALALAFALAAAFLHAFWNLLLARADDTESATAVALLAAVVVFAPVTALTWRADGRVWPFIAVTSLLQLVYFALLTTAYRRAELSVVYPLARGLAPVFVLVVGAAVLAEATSVAQVAGVCLVGVGVLLVRGLRRPANATGVRWGVAIAVVIASYTLLDKHGIRYAAPITYLELSMVPAAFGYAGAVLVVKGPRRIGAELRAGTVAAGLASFGAYALVLAALARASAASVAAVRETSIVIATALAARVLHERVGPARLAGAALVAVGIALLAL